MEEIRATFPLWIEFSGLPEFVNTKIRKEAWSVFKKIVELDCEANLEPGVLDISLQDLGSRTGLSPQIVEKCLNGLRKKKLLACFIPDNPLEKCLIRIVIPLKTPIPAQDLKKQRSDLFPPGSDFFRYFDERIAQPEDDEALREIIDLYFNTIGLKMNFFILDELRLLRQRFPLSDVKRVFESAKRLEIKNLRWVMRQLVSGTKKDVKGKRRKKKKGL